MGWVRGGCRRIIERVIFGGGDGGKGYCGSLYDFGDYVLNIWVFIYLR